MDQVNKQNTAHVRQALNGIKKRKTAVATAPIDNGVSALSAELQNEINIAMNHVTPTLQDLGQTTVNATTGPTVPKRRCIAEVLTQMVTTTMSVQTAPPKQMSGVCPW
jgi:hypothetical protein